MLGQAIAGLDGVTITDGGIALVGSGPALATVPDTDLDHDAFGGMRAFIEVAGRRTEPVKWQVTGPVTLGLGLLHAGLPATKAFAISDVAVTARVRALDALLTAAFPEAGQLMVLDEPGLTGMAHPGFPLEPRQVVDLLATALGATTATAGVHCCGSTDWSVIDQAGPAVLSIPADHGAIRSSGALADFLARGGRIAWGAIPTDGPRADSVDRYWRALAAVWCELVRGGCDPVRLRTQAIVTPECGLAPHTVEQADQVLGLTQEIADRVLDQAVATRFSLGA
jgi:methionine synthase II (cobalamin-independent)